MYYVIKRQEGVPFSTFIGFKVNKYIASKNNDSIILEFLTNDKKIRKWVKKEDIILLTDNKAFFLKTLKQFQKTQETQQKLVNEAQNKLDQSIETFTETMDIEINEFNEIKSSKDVPCLLKDLLS